MSAYSTYSIAIARTALVLGSAERHHRSTVHAAQRLQEPAFIEDRDHHRYAHLLRPRGRGSDDALSGSGRNARLRKGRLSDGGC